MKGTIQVDNPDQIEATLTITMSLYSWKEIANQLRKERPGWTITTTIDRLVSLIEKQWSESEEIE